MANNFDVSAVGGVTKTLQAFDNTSVWTMAHTIVRSDGTVALKPVAEDAAHSSGDTGIMALGVRQDTAAALGGTDGDYMPNIYDSSGRLWVNAGAIGTITPGTAASSLGKAEDAAHSSGDVGVFVLGVRNDVPANSLAGADGDYTPIQVDAAGKVGVRGTFAEDAAHTTGDLGHFILAVANSTHTTALSGTDGDYTPIAVDTTGKIGVRGTFAEDSGHSSGDLGIQVFTVRQDTAAALAGTDADYQPFITDGSGRLHVNVGSITAGTGATSLGKAEDAAHTTGDVGVFVLAVRNDTHSTALAGTDGDYTPIGVDSSGKIGIRGTFAEDVAHTSGDLGVQVHAVRTDVSASLSGTTGDYNPLITDESGKLWVHDVIDTANGVSAAAFVSADQSAAVAAVTDAPTSTKKLVITEILVSVGATAQTVSFTEETSGTLFARLYMAANTTQHIRFKGKQKLATADKKLMVQTSASGNVSVRASYRSET